METKIDHTHDRGLINLRFKKSIYVTESDADRKLGSEDGHLGHREKRQINTSTHTGSNVGRDA